MLRAEHALKNMGDLKSYPWKAYAVIYSINYEKNKQIRNYFIEIYNFGVVQ